MDNVDRLWTGKIIPYYYITARIKNAVCITVNYIDIIQKKIKEEINLFLFDF